MSPETELLKRDEVMIGHAQQRGQVIVTHNERRRLAVLRCWWTGKDRKLRPRAGMALVEFSDGKTRSVPHDEVRLPNDTQTNLRTVELASEISDPGTVGAARDLTEAFKGGPDEHHCT